MAASRSIEILLLETVWRAGRCEMEHQIEAVSSSGEVQTVDAGGTSDKITAARADGDREEKYSISVMLL